MDGLKQFWIERAPRERLILGAGGAVLLLVIGYLMLIEPAWMVIVSVFFWFLPVMFGL